MRGCQFTWQPLVFWNGMRISSAHIDLARYRSWYSALVLLLLCIGSRLLTTIYYIADPDSLRFAYAATDFDLVTLQPHFPGYPVFCFFLQLLTYITGKFSIAFSIIGGVSTFFVIHYLLMLKQAAKWKMSSLLIAMLVFLNPMIWIMGNRYMPDLAGLAIAVAAAYYFYKGREIRRSNLIFIFLAGLLAGTRLSYLPVLLLPVIWSLIKRPALLKQLAAGATGVLIWLVPMILDTGWNKLVEIAMTHTDGHFNDWGGTIGTEPSWLQRALVFIESIVADGMGGMWEGRHWSMLVFSVLASVLVLAAVFSRPRAERSAEMMLLAASLFVYTIWVFFFQNIIYNPRHIMPLLIPLLLLMVKGAQVLIARSIYFSALVIAALVFNIFITSELIRAHTKPTAIAEASKFLKEDCTAKNLIVSTELVNYYLAGTGVKCAMHTMYSLHDDMPPVYDYDRIIILGNFDLPVPVFEKKTYQFYHNPYVNRIWAAITVTEYRRKQ